MSAVAKSVSGARMVAVVPVLLVGIVLLMVVPLPPMMLDLLLACSIALAVTLMLTAIHMVKPLELSSFPTILLFATLLRLALNVASTRLILLHGSEGTAAAGHVIQSFGEFVVGGNYVVGAAVFMLLVVINFVVITKGAGRVAEVSARFTLDALPGKQMSIDADLAAGAMTQEQAKARRSEVEREADFFGAMDGASKFVRGDAIAGLIMTGINIVVGIIVGVVQQDMSIGDATSTYTVLTVGDGLASQIPALVVSVAAGVVVTRAASGAALATALVDQLGAQYKALYASSGILAAVGLMPGMPAIPFFALAGGIAYAARIAKTSQASQQDEVADEPQDEAAPSDRARIEEMLEVDLLELEVGFDLVPLVDATSGGDLVERIAAIRRNLASELGIIVPSVHIRDNLALSSNSYRLLLSGNELGQGSLRIGRLLAMDPTGSLPPIEGEQVNEPAFGLPARWVREADRDRAEMLGYTVVDPATVAATHLTELIRGAAPDLLGRTEAQELLDLFARREPRVVDELIPNLLSLGEVIAVMRGLLEEGVSVRDLRTILESLADSARETKDTTALVEKVRARLARQITSRFRGEDGKVAALVLDPRGEDAFRDGGPDGGSAQRLLSSLDSAARSFAGVTTPPLILCAPDVRRVVRGFLSRRIPGLSVLSFREIDPKTTVKTLGVVTA
ncbi:MAG: flagellar biosynthesis protein FlhA [Deltaproteobacteria bacterium]|nr:flagellar biosynthesis protein FlhA [Deltaproteobacteria bacterium]